MLIWANLLKLLKHQNDSDSGEESGLRMLSWIVQHFNVKDEEMVTIHMPLAAIYLLDLLVSQETTMARLLAGLDVLHCLLDVIPERTFVTSSTQQKQDLSRLKISIKLKGCLCLTMTYQDLTNKPAYCSGTRRSLHSVLYSSEQHNQSVSASCYFWS
jgi:predicted transcriptional regulator of viral defense system